MGKICYGGCTVGGCAIRIGAIGGRIVVNGVHVVEQGKAACTGCVEANSNYVKSAT